VTLYLARHGHTKLNSEAADDERLRGWLDVPLDARGRRDAEMLARDFAPRLPEDTKIFTSDLDRAKAVADEVAREARTEKPEQREELRPWDIGKLAGQRVKVVRDQLKALMEQETRNAPGGETYRHFRERWLGFLKGAYEKYAGKDKPTCVLVTHTRNVQCAKGWVEKGAPDDLEIDLAVASDYGDELPPGSVLELKATGEPRLREPRASGYRR
jgi:broad specificity phosphatase PhoE